MSLKTVPSKKSVHLCVRQNCIGKHNDYNNYLGQALKIANKKGKGHKTSRSFQSLNEKDKAKSKTKIKKKSEKNSRSDEIIQLKRNNEQISHNLEEKNKKISQLKGKIKSYELRIKDYENKLKHFQNIINENEHPTSPITLNKSPQALQQLKMIQENQKLARQSMDKYRIVQQEFSRYKLESQRKITSLMRQNEELKEYKPNGKVLDREVDQLKRQLKILTEYSNSKLSNMPLENEMIIFKETNTRLIIQNESLKFKIKEKQQKELELRRSLDIINDKVSRWSRQYEGSVAEKQEFEHKYYHLVEKYKLKKEKQITQKQEWAQIFQQFVAEVQKLKKEINRLEESNQKLVRMCYNFDE